MKTGQLLMPIKDSMEHIRPKILTLVKDTVTNLVFKILSISVVAGMETYKRIDIVPSRDKLQIKICITVKPDKKACWDEGDLVETEEII
jgi:hypothetical protein